MAQHAYVTDDSNIGLQPNGDLLLNCMTQYWEENGTTLTFSSDPLTVPVTITAGMNAAQANTEIVAAIKARAATEFAWTMASNTVIHRALNRG